MVENSIKSQLSADNISMDNEKEIKRQRDIANKRKRERKYNDLGFSRLKIYLGRHTYENLAEIYEDQQGTPLNIDGRKDIDSLSRVISFCINKVYEQMYIEKEERGVNNALPAKNVGSQELYDLYQAATFLQGDDLSHAEIKDKLSKEGCRPPNKIPGLAPKNKSRAWTVQQVKNLLDFEILNLDLEALNDSKLYKK